MASYILISPYAFNRIKLLFECAKQIFGFSADRFPPYAVPHALSSILLGRYLPTYAYLLPHTYLRMRMDDDITVRAVLRYEIPGNASLLIDLLLTS